MDCGLNVWSNAPVEARVPTGATIRTITSIPHLLQRAEPVVARKLTFRGPAFSSGSAAWVQSDQSWLAQSPHSRVMSTLAALRANVGLSSRLINPPQPVA